MVPLWQWQCSLLLVAALWVGPGRGDLTLMKQTCDADRRHVSVDTASADVVLAGLFSIREPGTGGIGCGLPSRELLQVYEAARWTIKQLNDNNYVSGVRFGMEAYDYCTLEGSSLEAVHEFYPKTTSQSGYCTPSSSKYNLGILGPMQSSVSMALGEMAPRIPAPVLSMRSSAPGLSNKNMYSTFLRTDQPVTFFAKAATALFEELQWERIVIVYADEAYGRGGYTEVLSAASEAGVCVAASIAVPHDGSEAEHRAKLQGIQAYGATAAVFYGTPTDALTTLKALQNIPEARNIKWLFGQLELETDYSSYTAAQGAIVAMASTTLLQDFKTYFTTLNIDSPPAQDPWLQDWYMNKYQCRLSGVGYAPFNTMPLCSGNINRAQDFTQSSYVEQTVLAIYAYAEAVKSACRGSVGVCNTLRNMDGLTFHDTYLSKVDVTLPDNFVIPELRGRRIAFDLNGDPLTSGYTFYNYNNNNNGPFAFQQFATYTNGNLNVTVSPSFPRVGSSSLPTSSLCPGAGCTNCLQPATGITLAYQPGDYVVMALVNAHESDHLSCRESIPDRLIEAVAVRYGLSASDALDGRGVSLGYLIVDVCPGVQVAQSFLTNLLGGYKLYTDESGVIISTTNIVAVLDMTGEQTAWDTAGVLDSLHAPHVRLAPSSNRLLMHSDERPYLMSAVPAQDLVQLATVQMLAALDWNYIQILSEPSGPHYQAAQNFRRLASGRHVCVGLWTTFTPDVDPVALLTRMREVQEAPVVVVFASGMHLRSLLQAVRTVTATPGVQRRLTFVAGSEEWGRSPNVFEGYEAEASGFLVTQLAEYENRNMLNWLSGLSMSAIADDPFLSQWYEDEFKCSLTPASRVYYQDACTGLNRISSHDVYLGYSPYIVEAVDTVARSLRTALDEQCPSTMGMCPAMGMRALGQRLYQLMRNSNEGDNYEIMDGEGRSDLIYFHYGSNSLFTNVGRFDTSDYQINNLSPNFATGSGAMANTVSTQCTGRCVACQYAYYAERFAYVPGDWLIGATFSIRHPGPDGQRPYVCGDMRTTNGFQYSAAMTYALDRINSGEGPVKLNNVTLGGLIMDHCNNEGRAYGQVSDVYSGLMELTWSTVMGDMDDDSFHSDRILAWMTDNTGSSGEAGEILQPLGVTMVSPSATAASLMDNPTFFRTLQGDSSIAMALVKLCKMLGFSYIQVVHAANSYGREGLSAMVNAARQEGLCVVHSVELEDEAGAAMAVSTLSAGTTRVVVMYMGTSLTTAFLREAAQLSSDQRLTLLSPDPYSSVVTSTPGRANLANLLSLRLRQDPLDDYHDFLDDIDRHMYTNPYYAQYYMTVFRCDLPGYYMYKVDCTGQKLTDAYVPSDFDMSTINAVYAVAGALQTTLVELCTVGYEHGCMEFVRAGGEAYRRFVKNLKVVQFQDLSSRQFRFLEREGNVLYDVLRFNGVQYQEIGSYGAASLELDDLGQLVSQYQGVQASCSQQCSECVFSGIDFSFTPGNIYLAGVFDVHKQGQGVFECGMINAENGFQLLEAFHFALQQVNGKKGRFANILPGVTLGGVGLDSCQSAIRGGYLVSNINNGLATLVRDGKEIHPEEIDAYIGSYSSDSSIYLARILTDLQIPQISYASTSTSLEDELLYPYFFRTVPADDKQVLGMLRYLDANNLRYVQVLYTTEAYGEQSKAQFDLLLRAYNFSICVAQRVAFPVSAVVSEESSSDVVTALLQKPVANTVVIFAHTGHIRAFLEAVARNPAAVGAFKFVGPTTWGDKHSVTQGIRDVANDAVTFALDFQGGVGNFLDSYLTKRTPANAGNNPWFEEWFQYILDCYSSSLNAHVYSRPCDANMDLKTKVIEDNTVLHVMNAVYSAAFALDATLKDKCGPNYVSVCETYRSSSDRRRVLRDSLERVNFTDDTGVPFYFEEREGNKGYQLFKLTSSPLDTDVLYNRNPIGTFDSDGELTLNMGLVPRYDDSCERMDACVECPTIRNRGVRFAVGGDPNGDITLVGVFDVHQQGTELYQCGAINMEGFQKFLTFWYMSETARQNGVRLLALDTCSSSLRVGQDLYGLLRDGTLCNSEYFDLDRLGMAHIGAVLVTEPDNALTAAHVTQPLKVTQVSADSVSTLLDHREYVLRSITPWSGYVHVLVTFLQDNGWTYVNSLFVSSPQGSQDYLLFQEMSKDGGLCLRVGQSVPQDPTDADIEAALTQLDGSSGAKVVVLFTTPPLTARVLRIADGLGIAGDYLWVFSMESEHVDMYFPAGLSLQALVLQPVIPDRDDVTDYIKLLTYDDNFDDLNRAAIPRTWWEDFYQTVHQCRLDNAQYPLDFHYDCPLDERIEEFNLTNMAHFTYLATAFSIRGLSTFKGGCRDGESIQECLTRRGESRQLLRDDILDVELAADSTVYRFVKPWRYIESAYDIMYFNAGEWKKYQTFEDGDFTAHPASVGVDSTCQRDDGCGCRHAGSQGGGGGGGGEAFQPAKLRNYYKLDSKDEQMYDWPVWAIVVAALTGIGLLITAVVFLYLLVFYPVKGGTSILGYLTMVGIMGVYGINFAFFVHASEASCGARRFLMGVVYTVVFAPLLVKAVDNWRFADLEYGNRPYRGLTSSCTLFLMALGIILIQCIIPIEWLILEHPTATHYAPSSPFHDYWWCDPHDFYDVGLVLSFIFIVSVVLLTAIFAAFAWDSESNNRESRWILVSAITTAGCFLVWMIVSTNAGSEYRDPAVAIANFFNATALLIFIPLRKLHLLCQARSEKSDVYANGNFDPYSNVYTNQTYDPEGDDYTYEPSGKVDDGEFITD